MLRLRRYRLLPALLALSLVLTAAAPLARASCGMTPAEMAERPCHPADVPTSHGGLHDGAHASSHDAPAAAEAPCHDPAPQDPCCSDEAPSLQTACCSSSDAPVAPALERVTVTAALVVLTAVSDVAAPEPPPSPPAREASPPGPVALHVLYGRFLT